MKKNTILIALLAALFTGCGSLGGFDIRTFHSQKRNIEAAIDSLYSSYPEYRMPAKWKKYDFWDSAGYGFLETRMFYFKNSPEEMYWVSFLEFSNSDSNSTSISIRSVFNGKVWNEESDTRRQEENRIQNRFDSEIISKLERFSSTSATRDN